MQKLLSLCVLCAFLSLVAPARAQMIFYSNPALENEIFDASNKPYLIGWMRDNILIGRNNENGFYISVYNDKMAIINKVLYKELQPEFFTVVNAVNLSDAGLLVVKKKPQGPSDPIILYTVLFSDTGVPIGEAIAVDTLTSARYEDELSRVYKTLTSENGKYVLVASIAQDNASYLVRAVLLENDNTKIRQYNFVIPFDEKKNVLRDMKIDNDGNVYILKHVYASKIVIRSMLYFFSPASDSVRMREMDVSKLKMKDLLMKVNNFQHKVFFYALYEGNSRSDPGGLYTISYDIYAHAFFDEKMWTYKQILPDVTNKEHRNLHLGEPIFLKDSGLVLEAQVRYTVSRGGSPTNGFGYGGFGRGYPSMYVNPFSGMMYNSDFISSPMMDYHADNVYVFVLDKYGKRKGKAVMYKDQRQADADYFLGYKIANAGNRLNYLYNDFLSTGTMALSSYVLDPKNNFVKKSFATRQNNDFSVLVRRGKQITPRAFLAPCVYKDKYLSFALVQLY